jgi:tetratricopeptide (TPR) repeat protein
VVFVFVVLAFSAAAAAGLLHWQERPLRQAQEALARNDAPAALEHINQYLADHPEDSRALAVRARTLVALEQPVEALAWFERVGAASPEDLQAWAGAYLMLQQYSQALPLLERVVELQPQNSNAWYELTACRSRLGRYQDALESARRFVAIPGNEARGYVFLGTLQSDMGNYREAAESYAQVLKHDPHVQSLQVPGFDFLIQYARTLQRAGQADQAVAPLEQSLAIQPSAEAYSLLGDVQALRGEPDVAAENWRKAVYLDPAHLASREALANAALQEGDAKEALEWLEPLKSGPSLQASTAYLFQRIATLQGDQAAANEWRERTEALRRSEARQAAFNNLLAVSPHSFWARAIRAHQFASQGNPDQAKAIVSQLLDENPREPFVVDLANALAKGEPLPSLDQVPLVRKE